MSPTQPFPVAERAVVAGANGSRVVPAVPVSQGTSRMGAADLRALLARETDRERFAALLDVWRERLLSAVRAGDLARAETWLRALVTDPVHAPEMADLVDVALDGVSTPDVLDRVLTAVAAAEIPGTGRGLVAAWGGRMVAYLVHGMTVDQPVVNRRRLTECLGWVGQEDVRLLAGLRKDPRWFVVRNLAIALGHVGGVQAVPALESLLNHSDGRVRVEALRGLGALQGGEALGRMAAALCDPEPRVRHAARSLLHALPDPEVVPAVVAVIESGAARPDCAGLVELIAERNDEGVPVALARLAASWRGGRERRAVRRAAREALRRLPVPLPPASAESVRPGRRGHREP